MCDAFFGVRWVAGDVPTFYIDVGSLKLLFFGHGVAYGKPVSIKSAIREDEIAEQKRHPKATRHIYIFEKVGDKRPSVKVSLGWNHMSAPHGVKIAVAGQDINYDLGSAETVQAVAKLWDAGWAEIKRDYEYGAEDVDAQHSSKSSYEENLGSDYWSAKSDGPSQARVMYGFEKRELDVSEPEKVEKKGGACGRNSERLILLR